jgi:glycosyltransferase involved in cell wall biosynthesis
MSRVLIVAYTIYAHDGRVKRNAEALAARGDRVDVICLEGDTGTPNMVNVMSVPVARYRGSSRGRYMASYVSFFARATRLAVRLNREEPYDLAVACSMPDVAILSVLPCRLSGAKIVLDIHDTMPELYYDKFGGRRGALGARLLMLEERACAMLADLVLAVHEPHAARLARAGVNPHKIRVVTNAPDPALFSRRRAGGGANDQFTIVCHGTLTRRLGLDTALRAMDLVRVRIPEVRLRVIGAGDYMEDLQRLARELKVSDIVAFEGAVPIERLARSLEQATVGLVPNHASSATHLMLPVKLLEYATLGVPVISADLRTIRQYFGDSLRYFEPGNATKLAEAIVNLYQDEHLRARLSCSAAQVARKISETQKTDYYQAVDSVLKTEESKIWSEASH